MPWSLRMVLYAGILLVLFYTYFGYRYFRSIRLISLQPLWLWRLVYLFFAVLFLAYPASGLAEYWLTGSFMREEYPFSLIYLFWYGLIFTGIMLNWLILHDILLPVSIKFSNMQKPELQSRFAKLFLIVALLTLFYTGGKLIRDTNRMTVEEISLEISGKPLNQTDPLTIVHIADLHADIFTDAGKMGRYIELVNKADPDLVIFAGDLVTAGLEHVLEGAEALENVQSRYGVYAVIGDHDYWSGADEITEALEQRGTHVLHNEQVQIMRDDLPIAIAGVTEIYSSRLEREALRELVYGTPDDGLKIVASHQATKRLIEFSKDSGTDMLLAGHTHGGQIRIPVFFYPFTAVRAETPYVNGHWQIGEMLLNINSGLGFTLSPVRYNAPAQVSVITINLINE